MVATTLLATLLAAAPAESRAEADAQDWSAGAGVGFGGIQIITPVGGLGTIQQGPSITMGVEHRLAPALWAMVLGNGFLGGSVGAQNGQIGSTDFGWGVGLGLRLAALQQDRFELSPYLACSYAHYDSAQNFGDFNSDLELHGVTGDFGLILQYEVMDRLFVRLASSLATLSWHRFEQQIGPNFPQQSDVLSGGIHLTPRVEVRMTF